MGREARIQFIVRRSKIQTRLHIVILLCFQVLISIEFFFLGEQYNLKLIIHSVTFFIAYYHVARYVFTFVTYLLASTPAGMQYTDGSFWHTFYIVRLYLYNTILYAVVVAYIYKYYMAL